MKKIKTLVFQSHSANQTRKLAVFLVKEIFKIKPFKNALVLALWGELGAGKTTFVQGFIKSAGIKNKITSPTFVIIKNYKLKTKNYNCIYHIDCYRIREPKELIKLGLKEIFKNPKNIILIEWAEKIKKILPKNTIWIKFKHGQKINQRTLEIRH